MAKDKFNWKSLFINDDEPQEAPKQSKSSEDRVEHKPSQSSSGAKFPDAPPVAQNVNDEVLAKILEMYESGFESLNKPGYDFYEFFKAVKAVGSNDPQVYKMALMMAQGVDKGVNKETLLTEAGYYIEEIEKVYSQYRDQGNQKRNQLLGSIKEKKESLTNEISRLEKKLMEIQNQISVKRNELQSMDSGAEVADIDAKIQANDRARTKILENIKGVAEGIKNNL